MIKRMTLLSRKEGTSTSDFRAYWSGCHAQLALCMKGITNYTQNRVAKTLWRSSDDPACFDVDGVVELCFENDEVMAEAQRSPVGSQYIPEDEPNFLRGWTLCVVDHEDEPREHPGVKVLIAAALNADVSRMDFKTAILEANETQSPRALVSFNWTKKSAKRERLWAEPVPPTALVALWFKDIAQAHEAFGADNSFVRKLDGLTNRAAAYLVDPLVVR
ncbi:hypothetical protein PPGU19_082100 (plasmid) [Paraburkholderia sp. PGU19]|uniref:EthD domain-containing protein n=1 Tax=Paraburkholderia sp. PGU19 TaxID=2735434 RepID=UPI0015DAC95D|nr:EthD domain-containing protein [Paraburkholderia sp. PGU19]BCG03642.1 hypothetical protein PPGU19_082100 [Paraburkholderia sp. PGU19]